MNTTPPDSPDPGGPSETPEPTEGHEHPRSLVRGNVGALALISLLNDWASEMIYPLLPLFLTSVLGAGPAFLGLIHFVLFRDWVAFLVLLLISFVAFISHAMDSGLPRDEDDRREE